MSFKEYNNKFSLSVMLDDLTKEYIDVPLPEPFDTYDNTINITKLGKFHKKGKNGTVVYQYSYDNVKELETVCIEQIFTASKYNITDSIYKNFKQSFDIFTNNTEYAVKVIVAPTYRDMISGLKEASINNEIYRLAETMGFENIICKPYFCSPYWDGTKWLFVIITEFATGKTLKEMFVIRKQTKQTLTTKLEDIIHQLWWLGYSHNNLKKSNIIYDKKSNSMKLVGLRKCSTMSTIKVECFRTNVQDLEDKTNFLEQYQMVFREESITQQQLSSKFENIDETEISTDDFVISTKFF